MSGVQTQTQDFVIEKFLGKGSYGVVHRVRRKSDNNIYALKQISTRGMCTKEREDTVNEIRILASITSRYIIRFLEAFVERDKICIVTEYARGGDLFHLLQMHQRKGSRLPESDIWCYFLQITLGLRHLHAHNILHRDLKSANVFLMSKRRVKIGDFGVGKILQATDHKAHTQVGTPYYVSPELWKNKPYNAKSDIWSLGCLLYEMAALRPPFDARDLKGLARKVMQGRYVDIPDCYSKELRYLVRKILVIDAERRPTADEIMRMPEVSSHTQLLPEGEEYLGSSGVVDWVSTIRVPSKRIADISKFLPSPQYHRRGEKELPTLPDQRGALTGRRGEKSARSSVPSVVSARSEYTAYERRKAAERAALEDIPTQGQGQGRRGRPHAEYAPVRRSDVDRRKHWTPQAYTPSQPGRSNVAPGVHPVHPARRRPVL
eukprot:Rmarinus@m.10326